MARFLSDAKHPSSSAFIFLSQEVCPLCCQHEVTLQFSLMSVIPVIMDSHCQPLLLLAFKRALSVPGASSDLECDIH